MIHSILIFLILTIFSCKDFSKEESTHISNRPIAQNGILDLTEWDFHKHGKIALNGSWYFAWNRLLTPEKITLSEKDSYTLYVEVPGSWDQYKIENEKLNGHGYATYHLRILTKYNGELALSKIHANTSFKLWVNGNLEAGIGNVGRNSDEASPGQITQITIFPTKGEQIDITIQVSNFAYPTGGLWDQIYIGTPDDLIYQNLVNSFYDIFLFGSLFIMGLYYLGLYVVRNKEKVALWFGLTTILFAFRALFTNQVVILSFFPNFPWELIVKGNFLTFVIAGPVFLRFLYLLYGEYFYFKKILNIIYFIGFLYSIFVILFPANFYAEYLIFYHLIILIIGVIILIALFFAFLDKAEGIRIVLIGILIMIGVAINDILLANYIINSIQLVPLGLFIFIFVQSFNLTKRFASAFGLVEILNISYSRFVPTEFVSLLNKKSITEVNLGDQVLREMTVLFSDISSFTSISESLTPQQTFDLLNNYLQMVGPIIRNMNGFIDKYIGDAIMAVFPENSEDGIRASIAILKRLNRYNWKNQNVKGFVPFRIGIGIHTGNLMLGTIGEEKRMEGTVISDAVNLSSRLEGLTKQFSSSLIVSKDTLMKIKRPSDYNYRYLGRVQVKGKNQQIDIYDFFDGDSKTVFDKKKKTLNDYNIAIDLYFKKEFSKAKEIFETILIIDPKDMVSIKYKN